MTTTSNLERLARALVKQGPYKYESTSRRVRALFNGKYIFDTTEAWHVWELENRYPQFYVPLDSFTRDVELSHADCPIDHTHANAYLTRLTVGNRSTDLVVKFEAGALFKHPDLVKVHFGAVDQWFEENMPIYCHPKDPYKRIDILPSTRAVKITLDGVTLAESSNSLFLMETTLPTRYYVPPTSVNWEHLTPSDTETLCPYKGKANYYNVSVNGRMEKDAVWYYRYPTMESAPIAGYLCFYQLMVDIWVDGKRLNRI